MNRTLRALAAGAVVVAVGLPVTAAMAGASPRERDYGRTESPIKHVVVIFQENVSFDYYFGTYPRATNTDGTPFTAARHTPEVNGLTPALLTSNPNTANPRRLDRQRQRPAHL